MTSLGVLHRSRAAVRAGSSRSGMLPSGFSIVSKHADAMSSAMSVTSDVGGAALAVAANSKNWKS